MPDLSEITFTDSKAAVARPEKFMTVLISSKKTIKSWQSSVFSFEWLDSKGKIKPLRELSEREQIKRKVVEEDIENKTALERPVLGMGLDDHVEIGSGRAVLLTLADMGLEDIEVHIPKSNRDDFKAFLSDA